MAYLSEVSIKEAEKMALDSFARKRVSQPYTLFDSKQVGDNRSAFWYDVQVSGSGTSSSYNINDSSSTLSVSQNTAGVRRRRTYQHFNYQPGKSHLILMTFNFQGHTPGVSKKAGYFNDKDGFYLESDGTQFNIVKRSYITGQVVETRYPQSQWNMMRLNDPSSPYPVLDASKAQILHVDMEWLGVGTVRFGLVIDGIIYYIHNMHHSNIATSTYMGSPNLPLTYEIIASGTNEASTMRAICSSVISEGGLDDTGIVRSISGGATATLSGTNGSANLYAAVGIKLKSTHLTNIIKLVSFNMMSSGNDDFEWRVLLNPTSVAGTFNYSAVTNSAVEVALGSGATNIVTGGTVLNSGYARQGTSISQIGETLRYIGVDSTGASESIVITHRPLTTNATMYSSLTWREFA